MTDPRQTLLQMMAALRKTIDPKVLDRARLAAEGKEPYDKEAARAAVAGFLAAKSRTDGGAFQRKLLEALKKEAAAGTAEPPPPPRAVTAKPPAPKAPAAKAPAPKTPGTKPLGKPAAPPKRRFGLF